MAGNQLYPSTELAACLARVSDILPQKDIAVVRKWTGPTMGVGGLGVAVLPVHCYQRLNETCTE